MSESETLFEGYLKNKKFKKLMEKENAIMDASEKAFEEQLNKGAILEKTPEQFTVVYKEKHFGFFCSRAGAEAFLETLREHEKISVDTTGEE